MSATQEQIMYWTLRGQELEGFETFKAEGDSPAGTPMYDVPISEINTFMFLNARKKLTNIDEMMASLETHGLLQPILVSRARDRSHHENTFLVSLGGFRRLEALRRKAIGHLVDRYNEDKAKGSKARLSFDDGEWFLKLLEAFGSEVHEALSKVTVNCNVKYVSNTLEAYYANASSDMREDVPIGDVIDRITELAAMGQKRNQIAEGMSILPESVSNYTKVGNLPYYVAKYICTGDFWDSMPDEQKAARLQMADVLLDDMLRRLHLQKTDDCSLKFTTLRKLGSVAMYGNDRDLSGKSFSDKYLHQEVVLEALKFLCRFEAGKINKDSPTPDLGTFNNFMQQMEARSNAMRREGSPVIAETEAAQGVEGIALSTPSEDAGSLSLGTDLPTTQTAAPLMSHDVAVAQRQAGQQVDEQDEIVSDEPAETNGEPEEEYQETAEDQFDNLVGGEDAGATSRVTASKPESTRRLQAVMPGVILKRAEDFSKWANDTENDIHPIERLAYYQTAAEMWNFLGFAGKHKLYAANFDQFVTVLAEYYSHMEEKAREAGFDLQSPALPEVPPELAHLLAEASEEEEVIADAEEEPTVPEDDFEEEEDDFEEDDEDEEEEEEEEEEDEDVDFEEEDEDEEVEDMADMS